MEVIEPALGWHALLVGPRYLVLSLAQIIRLKSSSKKESYVQGMLENGERVIS